jgi:uncharacterized protein YkvS
MDSQATGAGTRLTIDLDPSVALVIATVAVLVLGLVLASMLRLWKRSKRLVEIEVEMGGADRAVAKAKELAVEEVARIQSEVARAVSAAKEDLDSARSSHEAQKASFETAILNLKKTHEERLEELQTLEGSLDRAASELRVNEVGLYSPHYNYSSSEDFDREIKSTREEMRSMVRSGAAATCATQWTLENSKQDGARMQRQYSNCMLRAFNGECDAAVANVTWDNVVRLQDRIGKAYEQINQFGSMVQIRISEPYRDLRLAELRLVHEHALKKREEAEEQRRIREQMREEERAQRELERARREAEEDERVFARALEQAREEAAHAKGEELRNLQAKLIDLESKLSEAHARGERAMSQAQMTKSGHVYVISNIGSFGEEVVKVGMTRRLDPTERIRELGDASVPFDFDVHAIFFSDDAPGLESMLHKNLDEFRVNLVNPRKEFFKVPLNHLKQVAGKLGVGMQITLLAEAREYRETLARRTSGG